MADEDPELATNEHARKTHGLSQDQLAARVGVSQTVISKLESGTQVASDRILAICRVLKIPAPQHFADDESQMWSELGHLLRAGNPDQYKAARAMVEAMTNALPRPAEQTDSADADTTATRK